jgi:hypothetical protein
LARAREIVAIASAIAKIPFDKIVRDRVALEADEPQSKNPICAGLVQSVYVVECHKKPARSYSLHRSDVLELAEYF